MLDAWAELARDARFSEGDAKAAILTVAGDGEVERARDRVKELDIDDTVDVHDWLSESEVAEAARPLPRVGAALPQRRPTDGGSRGDGTGFVCGGNGCRWGAGNDRTRLRCAHRG